MPSTGKSEPRGRRFPGEALQGGEGRAVAVAVSMAAMGTEEKVAGNTGEASDKRKRL